MIDVYRVGNTLWAVQLDEVYRFNAVNKLWELHVVNAGSVMLHGQLVVKNVRFK